jgi:predicted type IV restriction endonuclease
LSVDGLLLLQADNCNYQIPAKAYEYIRAQKPVLALTPRDGDTGLLLLDAGVADIAPLDDKEAIKKAMIEFLEKLEKGEVVILDQETTKKYSRQYQAVKFEALLREGLESVK